MAPRRTRTTGRDRSRRVLSQNFLADPAAVARFVDAARPDPHGLVLEVGAGRGQLTRPLATRCGRLTAYEVDPVAATELARVCATLPNVTHRQADFLATVAPGEEFCVVGNIPWSLTAAVVRWCLAAPRLRAATLLTQLEYARRRTGEYGRSTRLTVLSWPEFDWRRVPRSARCPGSTRASCASSGGQRRCCQPGPYRRTAGWSSWGSAGVGGSLAASLAREHSKGRLAAALRASRLDPDLPVGHVWPEQWLVLYRLLHAR
nr:rRNA adenine N(6)-methyltransferase family protein [Verrucosispora sioxanthis]